jgi:predicted GNAT superfamily acetyltransferase
MVLSANSRTSTGSVLDPVISIHRLTTIEQYHQCEQLQEGIWGRDGIGRVPLLDLLTAQDSGGMVLGAFDEETLLGFVYSFLGMDPHHGLKQCSVLLAVAQEYRNLGIGRLLKLAQRDEALRQQINLITWTYDPLLAVNARLNIRRLGAMSRSYRVNHYGSPRNSSAGLDTDRLIVEWWLDRAGSELPLVGATGPQPVAQVAADGGLPRIAAVVLDHDADLLELPIPVDLAAILRCDFGLAQHWREQTRALFQAYFARGYAVVGFGPHVRPDGTISYLLQRGGT